MEAKTQRKKLNFEKDLFLKENHIPPIKDKGRELLKK